MDMFTWTFTGCYPKEAVVSSAVQPQSTLELYSIQSVSPSGMPTPVDEQPIRMQIQLKPHSLVVRDEVRASLERSLQENADVWAELARY